jgi:hypothetical protein
MFRPNNFETSRRRAVILMVVLVLLTLFAIVGLAFVLYANAEANSSRVYREAFTTQDNRIDIDANVLANFSMGQVLFDVPDPTSVNSANLNSAIRGHSLARDMYGWNTDILGSNTYAFNGVGRLHDTSSNTFGVDDHALLSYVPYQAFGFTRDPERVGTRGAAPTFAGSLAPWTGGWHPGYTYPDGNHVFLGAFDADGNVVARSFVRPYLLPKTSQGNPCLPLDPTSPGYWTWFADQNPNNPADTVPIDPTTKLSYLRYYSLRPRNADMAPGFPPPDVGGDVQNLLGFPGGKDSVWVDLDYPVQQAADGTYFKPLFAFFIADLDGRINLNTAANVRNTTVNPNTHLSNQGWGTWEVNPAYLSPATTDWPQMLVGNANASTVRPRYGFDQQPSSAGSVAASGQTPRVYGPVDFDGSDESGANQVGGIATGKYVLPSEVTPATNYASFPYFPKGYNNGFQPERTNHPSIYDSQYPGGDDRRFNANQHLLELYNGGPTSMAAVGTDLGKLLSTTLNPQLNQTAFRVRNMITTDSADRFVPGLTPWIYDRSATSKTNSYGYGAGVSTQAPSGTAVAFPALSLRPVPPNTAPPAPNTEFTVDWKSLDATIGSVDLNRFLPPYPHLGQGTTPATYSTTPLTTSYGRFDDNGPIQAQFVAAQQARQQLADDIYRRLLRVTGVLAPAAPGAPTAAELAPRRWLAQLAVNIVDFIDEDEISTPFNFYTAVDAGGAAGFNPGLANGMGTTSTGTATDQSPAYWVIGTELPKVVVNEVLAEYTPTAANATPFNVNVFVELFNPMPSAAQTGGAFPATAQQQDNPANPVPLWMGASGTGAAYAPYQVILADSTRDITATPIQAGLFVPQNTNDNVLGTPNVERAVPVDADFGSATAVKTIDGAATTTTIAPQQYFLMTPGGADNNKTFAVQKAGTAGQVPTGTPVVTSPNLTYQVQMNAAGTQMQLPNGTNITDGPVAMGQTTGITVLLRRLANPHMPPDLNPASATYNPYVTADYMTNVALQNTNNGEVSTAKAQPYAGNPSAYLKQVAGAAGTTADTFGQVNNATAVFDWLVHLDRQLISPMELLNVSGYHPHELTYQFLPKTGWRYGHQADWYTETNRLYRAFEFLGTRSRAGGVSGLGGRQPGKVNINAIWNKEVLEALADPQTGNSFTQAQVDAVFKQLMTLRTPLVATPPVVNGIQVPQTSGTDRPFLSMGIGNMPTTDTIGGVYDNGTAKPNNTGIEDTLLRSNGAGGRLFDVTGANHPYRQTELMTKVYNNLTTRSNTFAVWVTVGFFRVPTVNGQPQHVDNLATGPVKLAEEIGFATGTNIRHRIFTVVDRSKLTIARRRLLNPFFSAAIATLNQPTQVAVVATSGTTGKPNSIPWTIQAGSVLDIDVGTASEETVVVQQVAANTITATFTKTHAANATVNIPGNPGPEDNTWTVNSTRYPGLVLTYTVMQ